MSFFSGRLVPWPRLFLVSWSLTVTALVLFGCWWVSERYFFDRLYYAKDPRFGYVKPLPNPLANPANPPSIERRLTDLRLVFGPTTPTPTVDAGDFRVLVIGDSVVYGNGVKVGERLSARLERGLNQQRPTRVYTLAQSGDSIVDNYYKYQQAVRIFQPHLTIFGMVNNDLILDESAKYPGQQAFYDQLRQLCPQPERQVQWTSPQMTAEEGMALNLYPSFDPQYANLCYYRQIAQWLAGQPVLFYSFTPLYPEPPAFESDYLRQGWQVMRWYADVATASGLVVASPLNLENFTFTPVSAQESHPSAATHQQYARSLQQVITAHPAWQQLSQ